MKTVDFSETIEACDQSIQLIELMKVCEYSKSRSFLDLSPRSFTYQNYVSPLQGSGDILFFPLPLSVGLSVCGSICLSAVTKLCPLYNLITVTYISTKLHTFVKHIETTCHAQEP